VARGRERNFDYTPSYEATVEIAEKRTTFDTLYKDVKLFKPHQGANLIRILPPTWRGSKHYGLLIRLHRDVGPRDRQYLCLKENESSPEKRCPICDSLFELGARATLDEKRALSPQEAYIYYIIDRDDEKAGLQVWQVSLNLNSEIAAQCINRRSKAVINIIHPDHGYDLEFSRTGTRRNDTRYRGFHVMREPSPLSDNDRDYDAWLDEIFDRPLTDVLNFYSYEHIEQVFTGRGRDEEPRSRSRERDEEDRDDRQVERRRNRDDEEEDRRSTRNRRSDDDDDRYSRSRENDREDRRGREEERRGSNTRDDDDRERPRRTSDDDESRDRGRSRLSRDLDDEIPSDGGRRARSNGRDEDDPDMTRAVRQEVLPPEEPRRSSRARFDEDNNSAEETRQERPRRGQEDDDDSNERSRQRARDRLNRE
jgi:hypothetical protein